MRYKAVIFDRDGTLNRTTDILRPGQKPTDPTDGYVLGLDELELLPSVPAALAALQQNGIMAFVFTQQNCIGKGLLTLDGLDRIHRRLNELVGGAIAAFHVAASPDDPKAKPGPAMIQDILAAHQLDASEVLVAGDSRRDYLSAQAAGVDFVWVRDDKRRVSENDMRDSGCLVFDDVAAVARYVMQQGVELTGR